MAIPVERVNPKTTTASDFVPATSRYVGAAVLLYGEDRLLTFESYKRKDVAFQDDDLLGTVSPGQEYRPDLTALDAYGTSDLWWKIMEANNINDVYDYKAGINIRIPSPLNF